MMREKAWSAEGNPLFRRNSSGQLMRTRRWRKAPGPCVRGAHIKRLAATAVTGTKIAADAVGAAQLQDDIPIDMQDQLLTRSQLKDPSEASATPVVSAGTLTLDLETGNAFDVLLTENVNWRGVTWLGFPGGQEFS